MNKLSKATAAVVIADELLTAAKQQLAALRASRRILCSCGKRHAIAKLELLIEHFYTEPHGCSGGDYWSPGEWQFVCPNTNVRNRLLFHDYDVDYKQRGTIGVAAEPTFEFLYRGLFASSRNTHQDETTPTKNNYFVDEHRKQFELPEKKAKAAP